MRAIEKGIVVSRPTLEARYDLVLDSGGKLLRAQVKYVSETNGDSIYVDLRKETRNNGNKRTYRSSEIDCVLVYTPILDAILFIPPALFDGRGSLSIRITPPKSTNQHKIHFAEPMRW